MPKVTLETIKSWFKKYDKPTERQFSDTFDSLWHKDEIIPQNKIENLDSTLNQKMDVPDVLHYGDPVSDLDELASLPQASLTPGQRRYVHSERIDFFYNSNALKGDIAPLGQLNNQGFWIKDAAGSNKYIPVKGTYQDIKELKDNNELIPGQRYTITDYQLKYQIEGSDTSRIIQNTTISATPYNYYIYFASGIRLYSGDTVTITSLPDGYSGSAQVGDVGTVTASWGDGGHRISGVPILVGVGIALEAPYYFNSYIDNQTIKERFYSGDLTGTITSVADSDQITGTGTLFTQELNVGDTITYFVDAEYGYDRVIQSIESDTSLTITETVLEADIATDVTFEKVTFGKILMQPGGLINTDVHDGTVYSGLSADENFAPPVEEIVLTALTTNKFSTKGESATFEGDVIEYDFDDTDILDRQGNVIGTRNGLVTHRSNIGLNININHDWRGKRFRRFRLNDEQWEFFNHKNKEVYKLDSGSQIYWVGGMSGLSRTEKKRYMLTDLEYSIRTPNFILDDPTQNIFTNGHKAITASGGSDMERLDVRQYNGINAQTDWTTLYKSFKLHFNEIECRDITIIPLNPDGSIKSTVKRVICPDLKNTVFQDLPQGQGNSDDIFIDVKGIQESTFFTGGKLSSQNNNLRKIICVEDFDILNIGEIHKLYSFSRLILINYGVLLQNQFGGAEYYPVNFIGRHSFIIGSNSIIVNTVFAIGHTDVGSKVIISDTLCKDILIKYFAMANNLLKINGAFASIANHEDNNYAGNTWFQVAATSGCEISLTPGWYKELGHEFWLSGPVRDLEIYTDPVSKKLYYQRLQDGNIKMIEIAQPTIKWADVIVTGSVSNETPQIGSNITITISLENNGFEYLSGINLTSLLPDGYTYQSDDSNGEYDNVTGEWTFDELPTFTTKTINIVAEVKATGTYELNGSLVVNENILYPETSSFTITVTPGV
jgi:uncharacterized repeat protein (TIGR01451 family)